MISVDVGRKVAIWTGEGQPEKQAPLVKGPRGFCTADFGWGPLDTETPNLLLDVGPVLKRPSKKTQKKNSCSWKEKEETEVLPCTSRC